MAQRTAAGDAHARRVVTEEARREEVRARLLSERAVAAAEAEAVIVGHVPQQPPPRRNPRGGAIALVDRHAVGATHVNRTGRDGVVHLRERTRPH
eukprot:8083289-Pyramimonas_sp.AAC.1